MRKTHAAILVLFPLLGSPPAAADGALDTTFWSDGKIVVGGSTSVLESRKLVAAPDGRLVFSYKASDQPDTVFWRPLASAGLVAPPCATALPGLQVGSTLGLVFDPQGRLVVGATVRQQAPGSDYFGVALRFLYPSCQLDPSFDVDGRVDLLWSAYAELRVRALAARPDGSLRIAMAASEDGTSNFDLVVFALAAGGFLDPAFSDDGRAALKPPGGAEPSAIVIAPNGDLLVAGTYRDAGLSDFMLAQWSESGGLRNWQLIPMDLDNGQPDVCLDATLLADGRLALAGVASSSTADYAAIAVLRGNAGALYNLDPTFSGNGKLALGIGGSVATTAQAVVAQGDGKIVLAGWTEGSNADQGMVAVRLRTNGMIDYAFGTNGVVRVDFDIADSLDDLAYAAALSGGRIVLAGWATTDGGAGVAVARLENAYIFADGFETGSGGRWGKP